MKIAAVKISCLLGDPDANLLKVRDFLVELRRLARSQARSGRRARERKQQPERRIARRLLAVPNQRPLPDRQFSLPHAKAIARHLKNRVWDPGRRPSDNQPKT